MMQNNESYTTKNVVLMQVIMAHLCFNQSHQHPHSTVICDDLLPGENKR